MRALVTAIALVFVANVANAQAPQTPKSSCEEVRDGLSQQIAAQATLIMDFTRAINDKAWLEAQLAKKKKEEEDTKKNAK